MLERQPQSSQAHYVLGLACLFQKNNDAALDRFEQALGQDRRNPQYHFARAASLAGLGRSDAAIIGYQKALELRPRFFEALANLGNLLESAARFSEAARAYRRALDLRPDEALVLNGLGVCEIALGKAEKAIEPLRRAVQLQPNFTSAINNLARALAVIGKNKEAIELYQRAVSIRPDFLEAWMNLGERLYLEREDEAAIASFDRALALDPSNDEIRFLRNSIAGVTMDRAPDRYVRSFFDRFANQFDQRLTQDLEYRTPGVAAEFLASWLAQRQGLRVADLGCGTGLSGIFVRPKAAFLAGVDLSGKMLERARERAIYDELAEEEIARYLERQSPGSFDLILALDVLVYVGDLGPIVRGCAKALSSGGILAFSVEHLDDSGGDFQLARTTRFVHAPKYIAAIGTTAGLRMMASRTTVIRKEDKLPVVGDLYALEKP